MSDDRDVAYAAFGFFFGIWSFFKGFNRFRRKRLIQNIPTSTIRGMAIGLVELIGKAENDIVLKSPLTNSDCVLYQYLIEEYRSSGKSGSWVKIASGDSFYSSFCISDETGKIMVLPRGAELIFSQVYEFSTSMGKAIPINLIKFMETNGISYKNWLGSRALRFHEWCIHPQDTAYVLGSAIKKETPRADYKLELMRRIEELKKSPEKMKEVDSNKDKEVSFQEWDQAVAKLEDGLLNNALNNLQVDNSTDVIIGKGDVETVFIISDHSEKELIGVLTMRSFLGIYGGAVLSLVLMAYLLFRLNLFKF